MATSDPIESSPMNPTLSSPMVHKIPFDPSLLSGRLSEVHLKFCNQRYRDKFPCTLLCDFLRDACDVLEMRATSFLVLRALFALMVGGFARFKFSRILTSRLQILREYDSR